MNSGIRQRDTKLINRADPVERSRILGFAEAVVSGIEPEEITATIRDLLNASTPVRVKRDRVEGDETDSAGRKNKAMGEYTVIDSPDWHARKAGVEIYIHWHRIALEYQVGRPVERQLVLTSHDLSTEEKAAEANEKLEASPEYLRLALKMSIRAAMKSPEGREMLAELIEEGDAT